MNRLNKPCAGIILTLQIANSLVHTLHYMRSLCYSKTRHSFFCMKKVMSLVSYVRKRVMEWMTHSPNGATISHGEGGKLWFYSEKVHFRIQEGQKNYRKLWYWGKSLLPVRLKEIVCNRVSLYIEKSWKTLLFRRLEIKQIVSDLCRGKFWCAV